MSVAKQLVNDFYQKLWDAHDKDAMVNVLASDFTFRGSLGQEKRGHQGFADYVDLVHSALADYKCHIIELVAEEHKVFAKMSFTGIHYSPFMGFEPTGERVTWSGSALFTIANNLIVDVWVLGDLKSLQDQLETQRDQCKQPLNQ
jgi:predicted ester cyclase